MSMILNPYRYAGAGGPTFGNASRDFEQSNAADVITIGTGPNADLSDAISVSFFAKFESFVNAYTGVFCASTGGRYFQPLVKSNGKLACYLFTTSPLYYDGGGTYTLSTGTWHHVGMSYSSTDGLKGYVDGALDASVPANGTMSFSPSTPWAIGRDPGNTGRWFDGLAASCRLYNTVLSASDFSTLAGGGDVSASLIGHWVGNDDIVGSTVENLANPGTYDGTNNGSTYSTDGPFD